MPMKNSDDYITARAANPWTGLISPSVGSPTPKCRTPDTPSEALQLRRDVSPSPTPAARPTLSRANEGRKVSGGTLQRWRANANGWISEVELAAASPGGSHVVAGAELSNGRSSDAGDRFIINMPSAREPQPYPEISGRWLSESLHKPASQPPHQHHARAVTLAGPQRCMPWSRKSGEGIKPDVTAASFAPCTSPRTPKMRHTQDIEPEVLRTVHVPDNLHNISPPVPMPPLVLSRKPVGGYSLLRHQHNSQATAQNSSTSFNNFQQRDESPFDAPQNNHATFPADLSRLPPLRLVHPTMASQSHAQMASQQNIASQQRVCSLGCSRDQSPNSHCSQRCPQPSSRSISGTLFFDLQTHAGGGDTAHTSNHTRVTDFILHALRSTPTLFLQMSQYVHLPDLHALAALTSQHSPTPQQKIEGLKAALLLVSEVSAFLIAVSVVWRLSVAVAQVTAIVFWPLLVLIEAGRWVVSF
ncbi:hypothetical protein LTR62_000680 [Meristemomyces frigidus]|uniref:Uncharacterized protein n=1 Tax=Meristemomyces frigidus TaxID=1508187 RepID=A0AAN7YGP8_9PEZI|nr:hypothetical protein LTR62_000680 [Meristemomyces frigidus]